MKSASGVYTCKSFHINNVAGRMALNFAIIGTLSPELSTRANATHHPISLPRRTCGPLTFVAIYLQQKKTNSNHTFVSLLYKYVTEIEL